mmetsp:Transcript_69906/g.85777  ORF Transcript_69906/g.85777 Transcript_69906/m.85777 type:complete len:151 (-) Transcript_69906:105-557(-)
MSAGDDDRGCYNCFFTLLWLILGGFFVALLWCFVGIILCITIIGIPFGTQCIKISRIMFCPLNNKLRRKDDGVPCQCCCNVLWFLLAGWWLGLFHIFCAIICLPLMICCIPFTKIHLNIARVAFFPFGMEVIDADSTFGNSDNIYVIIVD